MFIYEFIFIVISFKFLNIYVESFYFILFVMHFAKIRIINIYLLASHYCTEIYTCYVITFILSNKYIRTSDILLVKLAVKIKSNFALRKNLIVLRNVRNHIGIRASYSSKDKFIVFTFNFTSIIF